jgi:hypothetical protein
LSVAAFVIDITGTGYGVFEAGLARRTAMPSAISQFVAALINQSTGSSVDDQLAITQANGLGLKPWLGHGIKIFSIGSMS